MTKEETIAFLERRIDDLDHKIDNFMHFNISDHKREKLEAKKLKYEAQLAELQA